MNGIDVWLTIIFCGLVTIAVRASFIVLSAETQVPNWLHCGLKYVAAAVLPALIAPDVLFRDLQTDDVLNVYRIIAAMLAGLVAYKTKSTLATLITGMTVLLLLKWGAPF